MQVVVVESPSKAKTINKYLGKDYTVLASFGHVRDLPAKDGSVDPERDFAMTYHVEDDSKKHISDIARALKGANALFLATDPDREGEAISWHVLEALKESKALPKDVKIKRVVFEEITKRAVQQAFEHPRDIDMDLVNAQQARRALDYLVGFTLSPVLWRKLPGSKSAGRVQSVALRLICERDSEIEQFISREYWDIKALVEAAGKPPVTARLVEYNGEKLEKFSITNETQAQAITADLKTKQYRIAGLEPKQVRRHPAPPFTTSTLQQEASRKCGFGAKKTMQLAQKLYEGIALDGETTGLITYMRTDSVALSQEAVSGSRAYIEKAFGKDYLPAAPRLYKTKAKNAQEAHEAIRPTDLMRAPEQVRNFLDHDMFRLYELVWKRTIASQMESAVYDQLVVDIASLDSKAMLRTTGSVVKFDGFLKLYQEGEDDKDDDGDESQARLPNFALNESLSAKEITPEQHFTEPPPRYSEASLVKKLEELGIGRPSTYASIISVLQDRSYVKLEKKRFIAETLGRVVNAFLVSFFERYVEYGFTADLENKLDDVSAGERDWKQVLREFWGEFIARIEDSKKLPMEQVLSAIDDVLDSFLFGAHKEGQPNPRQCPSCAEGRVGVKVGRYGAYLGCSRYPDCNYKRQIGEMNGGEGAEGESGLPRTLGSDPANGLEISLRKGPYGLYVQLGDGKAPKRASLPKSMSAEVITLENAIALLSLPREVGIHPETKKPIVANNGRFGPYLLHDGKFHSLPAEDDLLTIGINRAVDVIANSGKKQQGSETLRELGEHPDGGKITVLKGRYGPYIKYGKINATLTKGLEPSEITLEQALGLLAAKGGGSKGKGKAKAVKPAKAGREAKADKPAKAKPAAKTGARKKTA